MSRPGAQGLPGPLAWSSTWPTCLVLHLARLPGTHLAHLPGTHLAHLPGTHLAHWPRALLAHLANLAHMAHWHYWPTCLGPTWPGAHLAWGFLPTGLGPPGSLVRAPHLSGLQACLGLA